MRYIEKMQQTNMKLLKVIIRGILGQEYKEINDIPEDEQEEVETFLKSIYKGENGNT